MKDEYNMKYFSESFFRGIVSRMPLHEQSMFSETVQRAPIDKRFDLFLSYNISDLNVVKGIYYGREKKDHRTDRRRHCRTCYSQPGPAPLSKGSRL